MNLSIVLNDFIGIDGTLKTYRFIPINPYNSVVVDRLSDIHMDIKGNTDQDIGLLRIYNSDKCQLTTTSCKIKRFQFVDNTMSFEFEHMYVPVDYSHNGSCGIYSLALPIGYKFTDLHIIDPFDKSNKPLEYKKHFKYQIFFDKEKELQIVQMELRSGRGSFSFFLKGKAQLSESTSTYLESIENDIRLDDHIRDFFFDEEIKKSFWKNLKDSLILEPNFNGIGIDFKKLFKK